MGKFEAQSLHNVDYRIANSHYGSTCTWENFQLHGHHNNTFDCLWAQSLELPTICILLASTTLPLVYNCLHRQNLPCHYNSKCSVSNQKTSMILCSQPNLIMIGHARHLFNKHNKKTTYHRVRSPIGAHIKEHSPTKHDFFFGSVWLYDLKKQYLKRWHCAAVCAHTHPIWNVRT